MAKKFSELPELQIPDLNDIIATTDVTQTSSKRTTPQGIIQSALSLTESANPALGMRFVVYLGNTPVVMTFGNMLKGLSQLGAATSPDLNDRLIMYDINSGDAVYVSIAEVLSQVGDLTTITGTPQDNDYFTVYDSSIGAARRVRADSMIPTGSITNSKLGSNSVRTGNIQNAQVTSAKLASDSVTSSKIADGAVDRAAVSHDVQNNLDSYSTDRTLTTGQTASTIRLTGSNSRTFTLPNVGSSDVGIWYRFVNDSTAELTIDGNGSDTIDGETTRVLGPGDSIALQAMTTSNWRPVGGGGGGGTMKYIGSYFGEVTSATDDMWRGTGLILPSRFSSILIIGDNYTSVAVITSFNSSTTIEVYPKATWDSATEVVAGNTSVSGFIDIMPGSTVSDRWGKGANNEVMVYPHSSSQNIALMVFVGVE